MSILSFDGKVQFGLITDAEMVPDPQEIIDRFAPEFEKLVYFALLRIGSAARPSKAGRRRSRMRSPARANGAAEANAGPAKAPGETQKPPRRRRRCARKRPPPRESRGSAQGSRAETSIAPRRSAVAPPPEA